MHKIFAIALLSAYASAAWSASASPARGKKDGSSQDNAILNSFIASVASGKQVKTDLYTYMKRDEQTSTLEFHGDSVIYGEELTPTFQYGWCMDMGLTEETDSLKKWDCQSVLVELYDETLKDDAGKIKDESKWIEYNDQRFEGEFADFTYEKLHQDQRKTTEADIDATLKVANDALKKALADTNKKTVEELTEDELKTITLITREQIQTQLGESVPSVTETDLKFNWANAKAKSHLNCTKVAGKDAFKCEQPVAPEGETWTESEKAKKWMDSGVNFHFARNFVTEDMAGYDRQFTKEDAADIEDDAPQSINAFSFYFSWPSIAKRDDNVTNPTLLKSGKVQTIIPFSEAAYKALVTDPDAAAAKKAKEEADKLAKEEEAKKNKDGAQQITASAAAVLAAAYALSF